MCTLEDVERIHRRDPYGIRLVGESEGSRLRSDCSAEAGLRAPATGIEPGWL